MHQTLSTCISFPRPLAYHEFALSRLPAGFMLMLLITVEQCWIFFHSNLKVAEFAFPVSDCLPGFHGHGYPGRLAMGASPGLCVSEQRHFPTLIIQTTFAGMASFPLLAIRFSFWGQSDERGGITEDLVDFPGSLSDTSAEPGIDRHRCLCHLASISVPP